MSERLKCVLRKVGIAFNEKNEHLQFEIHIFTKRTPKNSVKGFEKIFPFL